MPTLLIVPTKHGGSCGSDNPRSFMPTHFRTFDASIYCASSIIVIPIGMTPAAAIPASFVKHGVLEGSALAAAIAPVVEGLRGEGVGGGRGGGGVRNAVKRGTRQVRLRRVPTRGRAAL